MSHRASHGHVSVCVYARACGHVAEYGHVAVHGRATLVSDLIDSYEANACGGLFRLLLSIFHSTNLRKHNLFVGPQLVLRTHNKHTYILGDHVMAPCRQNLCTM